MNEKYEEIIRKLGKNRVKLDEPMSRHTTFKIGGPADLFYEAKTGAELEMAVAESICGGIPFFILGGGSNTLVSDKGIRGLVIRVKIEKLAVDGFKITAGAGVLLGELVGFATANNLTGLEFAAGIPGTVGGAIRGNAGAWQQQVGDLIESVSIIAENGSLEKLSGNECGFSYRESRFKYNREIILEATFTLKSGDYQEINKQVNIYLEKRSGQPKEPSAGSVFVNPKPTAAGQLIDECGLKGKTIGGAMISPKHANFIVNTGNATARDVLDLIKLAKEAVKAKFNLELKEEVVPVGEF